MKRGHALLLGILAFSLCTISLTGTLTAPPCISSSSVPRQYPIFVISFCINYVLTTIAFAVAGTMAFCYALREEK